MSIVDNEQHQLQLACQVLLAHFKTVNSQPLADTLEEVAAAGKPGLLGAIDTHLLRQTAGFDATDAALDHELPVDAVTLAATDDPPSCLKTFASTTAQADPLARIGHSSTTSQMLDPNTCHARLAKGDALVFPQAWRILPGLRQLRLRLAQACVFDIEIQALLVPPMARSSVFEAMPGHALLIVADGKADIRALLPSGQPPIAQAKSILPSPHGLLRAFNMDGLEAGGVAYLPDTPRSLNTVCGAEGAMILLISLGTPTWRQLAEFALRHPSPELSARAHTITPPPALLPSQQDLQMFMAARRRDRHETRSDVRKGRLHDIFSHQQVRPDTQLSARIDRKLSVDIRPPSRSVLPGKPGNPLGLLSANRVCYVCFGNEWCVPADLQPWIDHVLALPGNFAPSELPAPPVADRNHDRLVLCRQMVALGLLQIFRGS